MTKVSVFMWPRHYGSCCEVSGMGMDPGDGGGGTFEL